MSRRMGNSTAGHHGGSNSATSSHSSALHSEDFHARMGQILDEQDHKRCSEGNHRALLAENLDQLRGLLKVLEADDWKYAPSSSKSMHPFRSDADGSAAVPSRW